MSGYCAVAPQTLFTHCEPSRPMPQLESSTASSVECQQRLQDAELVIAELQEEAHQRELQHEKDLMVRGIAVRVGGGLASYPGLIFPVLTGYIQG